MFARLGTSPLNRFDTSSINDTDSKHFTSSASVQIGQQLFHSDVCRVNYGSSVLTRAHADVGTSSAPDKPVNGGDDENDANDHDAVIWKTISHLATISTKGDTYSCFGLLPEEKVRTETELW
jgi:hypothetical protein